MQNNLSEEFLRKREKVARQMKTALIGSLAVFGLGLLLTIIGFSLGLLVLKTFGLIMVGFGGLSAMLFAMFCLKIRQAIQNKDSGEMKGQPLAVQLEPVIKPTVPAVPPVPVPAPQLEAEQYFPEAFQPDQPPVPEKKAEAKRPKELNENTKQRLAALNELLKENIILPDEYEKMRKSMLEES